MRLLYGGITALLADVGMFKSHQTLGVRMLDGRRSDKLLV